MSQDLINNDLHVNGALSAKTFNPPASCITAAAVVAAAGIEATKLQQQYHEKYSQVGTATAAADQKVVHVAYAGGTIVAFKCSCRTKMTAGGSDDRSVTFDLKKNGTSVLSAAVVLSKANLTSDMLLVAGTINTTTFVAGDVLEVVVSVAGSVGTQALGPFAEAIIREDPQ